MLSRWKKASPLDFQQFNHFKFWKMRLRAHMLTFGWKGRALIDKVNSRCFCWFPAAIFVYQNCTKIWRLHTKLYYGAWNTVGPIDLRLGQLFIYQSIVTFHFLGFFHWTVSNSYFFLPCLLRDNENELLKIQNISHATLCFLFDFCILPQTKLLSNPTCWVD